MSIYTVPARRCKNKYTEAGVVRGVYFFSTRRTVFGTGTALDFTHIYRKGGPSSTRLTMALWYTVPAQESDATPPFLQ